MNARQLQVAKIVASVVVIAGTLTYLVSTSMSDQVEYFYTADQVMAKGADLEGQRIRLGGFVLKDSILQKPGTLDYIFKVRPVPEMVKEQQFKDGVMMVRYSGVVPDTFKDDAQVVVTGRLQSDGSFTGEEVLAKCPSKYEAEEKNKGTY